MIKEYLQEVFEPTLLFGMLAGLAGLSAAVYYGNVRLGLGILAIAGAITVQIAVNLIDDYSDYKIGLDKETRKTKFSGGSALVTSRKVSTRAIFVIAVAALVVAGILGMYVFYMSHTIATQVLVLVVFGLAATVLYARYLTHVPFFAEPFIASCFAAIGLGVFLVSSGGTAYASYAVLAFIPCGMQVGAAALVNAIPDRKPDRKYGRRGWAVMLNSSRLTGTLYVVFQAICYILIIFGMIARYLPYTFAIMLAFMPAIQYVARGIRSYKSAKPYERIMGYDAVMTMSYMLFISVAYLTAAWVI